MENQNEFDQTIGRLDHVLSKMMILAKSNELDEANRQTLKHHAEDMVLCGEAILLKVKNGES